MSRAHLRPCAGCGRHIRVSEAACPFCGVEASADFRALAAPASPRSRLTRAALFALGTSSLAVASGCGAQASDTTKITDDGGEGKDAGFDAQGGIPTYGGPPLPFDAGPSDAGPRDAGPQDAGPADAAQDFDVMVGAAYGGPGGGLVDAAYGAPPFGDD